jgi:hypothetical protein
MEGLNVKIASFEFSYLWPTVDEGLIIIISEIMQAVISNRIKH